MVSEPSFLSNSWLFKDTILQKQPLVQEWPIMLSCLVDAMSFGKNNHISACQNVSNFFTLYQSCHTITFLFGYMIFVVSDLVTTLHTTQVLDFWMPSLRGKQTLWFDIGVAFFYILKIIFLLFTINKPSILSEYHYIFCSPLYSMARHVLWRQSS